MSLTILMNTHSMFKWLFMSHYSGTEETWSTSTNSVVNSLRALIDFLDSVRYCIWLWEISFLISRRLIGQPHYFPFLCHDVSLDNPITFLSYITTSHWTTPLLSLYHDVSLDNPTTFLSYVTTSHWTAPLLSLSYTDRVLCFNRPHNLFACTAVLGVSLINIYI